MIISFFKMDRRILLIGLATALAGCTSSNPSPGTSATTSAKASVARVLLFSVSPPVQPLPAPGKPSPATCPAGGTCCSVVAFKNGSGGFVESGGTNYVSVTLTNSTSGATNVEPSDQYGLAICDVSATPPTFVCASVADATHVYFMGITNHAYIFNVFFECPAPSPTNWSGVFMTVTQ